MMRRHQPTRAPRPKRRAGGFSLIELIVVMAILAVVTTLGVTTFSSMTGAWHDAKTLAELDTMAGDAFRSMQRDFADVISASLCGSAVRGIRRDIQDALRPSLADDRVVIPIQTAGMGRSALTGGAVMYQVVRSGGRQRLVRTVGGVSEEAPSGSPQEIVERAEVIRLRFEYAGEADSQWLPDWHRPTSPRAVRVSLTLADLYRPDLQIARKTVFPIYVR